MFEREWEISWRMIRGGERRGRRERCDELISKVRHTTIKNNKKCSSGGDHRILVNRNHGSFTFNYKIQSDDKHIIIFLGLSHVSSSPEPLVYLSPQVLPRVLRFR